MTAIKTLLRLALVAGTSAIALLDGLLEILSDLSKPARRPRR